MATTKPNTVQELWLSLGLDIDKLDADFIAADKTVAANLRRMRQELKNTRLEIDVANSDKALSASERMSRVKAAEAKQTQILKEQVDLLSKAYADEAKRAGEGAQSTLRQKTALLRAQKELNASLSAGTAAQTKQAVGGLSGKITGQISSLISSSGAFASVPLAGDLMSNITSKISGNPLKQLGNWVAGDSAKKMKEAFSGISSALSARSFSGAASSVGSLASSLGGLAIRAAGVGAAVVALGVGIAKASVAAIQGADSIFRLSQQMHTSIGAAVSLNRTFSMMGADTGSAVYAIMRLDKSVANAGASGNEATRTLAAFGVSLQDGSGAMLSYDQQLAALAEGYKKAKAAGLEEEFVMNTLGTRGKELVGVLDDYAAAQSRASQVVTAGILDPGVAHSLSLEYNQMISQVKSFGSAFIQSLVPIAAEVMPSITGLFRELTQFIRDNRTEIVAVMRVIGSGISIVIQMVTALAKAFRALWGVVDTAISKIAKFAEKRGWLDAEKAAHDINDLRDEQGKENHEGENTADNIDYEAQARALSQIGDAANGNKEALQAQKQAEQEAAQAHEDAMNRLRDADATYYHAFHSASENAIYDIEAQEKADLQRAKTTEQGYAIMQQAAAKYAALQEEGRKAAAKNYQDVAVINYGMTLNKENPFDNYKLQVVNLQNEAAEQMKTAKTAEEAQSIVAKASAKMAENWKSACDKIRDLNQSLQDKIFKLTHSDIENKRYDLLQEARKMYSQGADSGLIAKWLNLSLGKLGDEWRKDGGAGSFTSGISARDWAYITGNSALAARNAAAGMQEASAGENRQDYYLHVDVNGLDDVGNRVAQTAAQKIIAGMPNVGSVSLSYAN